MKLNKEYYVIHFEDTENYSLLNKFKSRKQSKNSLYLYKDFISQINDSDFIEFKRRIQ